MATPIKESMSFQSFPLDPTVHDFVTTIPSSEFIRRFEEEASRSFKLWRTSSTTETLTSITSATGARYMTKTSETGGILGRKPHIRVTRQLGGNDSDIAEVRFEPSGKKTTILYKATNVLQTISLLDVTNEKQELLIGGKTHCWQHLGPSRAVMELRDDDQRRIAIFVYAGEVPDPANERVTRRKSTGEEVGSLHVLDIAVAGSGSMEELLCSGMAIVERAKRRRSSLGR